MPAKLLSQFCFCIEVEQDVPLWLPRKIVVYKEAKLSTRMAKRAEEVVAAAHRS
ncbi:hypothetical protein QCA50_007945 [Cerrena zonata]|uniref:LysR family transcriptional regulator n=1 Tax=Cerrena zonata TaxID=2478898 RepID=A0AAW0FEF7_9APHY